MIFLVPFFPIYSGGRTENSGNENGSVPSAPPVELTQIRSMESHASVSDEAGLVNENLPNTPPAMSRAEEVLRAFAAAYPDRIRTVEFYDGDWTIVVYRERFFWAEGRILPENQRHRVEDFTPQSIYNYPAELPPFEVASPEENERMRRQEELRINPVEPVLYRSPHFFDALWRTHNQHDAWENVKSIRFLGTTVMVNNLILTQLSLVEKYLLRLANSNSDVRRWIDNLSRVEGWYWRDIAETQNRSYHSYGAAIDLLPGNLGNQQSYWLWSTQHYPEWWNIPYTRRYHPPMEAIRIFESFGFVWGGKWRRFDTMHFEYRPEIIILSGIPLMNYLDME